MSNAHDALADVYGTIEVSRLIKERASDLWRQLKFTAHKSNAVELLLGGHALLLLEFFFNREFCRLITECGQNPNYNAQIAVFDLAHDPAPYLELDVRQLIDVLSRNPKVIRAVRTNAQPVLLTRDDAPDKWEGMGLSDETLEERKIMIREADDFRTNVGLALDGRYGEQEPAPWPEAQIYGGFPGYRDNELMQTFHHASTPKERFETALRLEDRRLQHFALRIIFEEAPEALPASYQSKIRNWVRERVTKSSEAGPWLSLPDAIDQTELMIAERGTNENSDSLNAVKSFYENRLRKV